MIRPVIIRRQAGAVFPKVARGFVRVCGGHTDHYPRFGAREQHAMGVQHIFMRFHSILGTVGLLIHLHCTMFYNKLQAINPNSIHAHRSFCVWIHLKIGTCCAFHGIAKIGCKVKFNFFTLWTKREVTWQEKPLNIGALTVTALFT